MESADVILRGFQPYGAVALVSLGFGAGLVLVVLRWLQGRREVRLAKIAARKELELAKLRQGAPS